MSLNQFKIVIHSNSYQITQIKGLYMEQALGLTAVIWEGREGQKWSIDGRKDLLWLIRFEIGKLGLHCLVMKLPFFSNSK